jgi:hypothetical protein
MTQPRRSQRSGRLLDPDAPTTVTYVFDDGHRREVVMTAAEADDLRHQGDARTSLRERGGAALRRYGKPAAKAIAIAATGAFIGALISDHYADRQRELELEADVITAISRDTVRVFQRAQEAARATDDPQQRRRRDRAADEWVLRSSELTPMFRTYFADDAVRVHWDRYQDAVYNWAVLGCCTTEAGRARIVELIRRYVTKYVGPSTRTPPTQDPWSTLKAGPGTPGTRTYQWLGFYLLRGRGALLRDLKEASPDLD